MPARVFQFRQSLYKVVKGWMRTRDPVWKYAIATGSSKSAAVPGHIERCAEREDPKQTRTGSLRRFCEPLCSFSRRPLCAEVSKTEEVSVPYILGQDRIRSGGPPACVQGVVRNPWRAAGFCAAPLVCTGWWKGWPSISRVLLDERLGVGSAQPILLRPPSSSAHTQCPGESGGCGSRGCGARAEDRKQSQGEPARPSPPREPRRVAICSHRITDVCAPPPSPYMDLACKTAVVTGGASGIGLAACKQLLAEGAERVFIADLQEQAARNAARTLNKRFGEGKAVPLQLDVRSGTFDCAFRSAMALRGVQILFNGAGVFDERNWRRAYDTNVKGVLRGCSLAMRYMSVENGGAGGVVVNLSAAAAWDAVPTSPTFCASKRAVVSITECFGHQDIAERTNVRVVSLCPGKTNSSFLRDSRSRCYQLRPDWARHARRAPSGGEGSRSPQPADAAGMALAYLARFGSSGDHYVVEGSCVRKVQLPVRDSYSRHVATFV